MKVYVVVCGGDTKVFEAESDAKKYYDTYNNNIEMSGSNSGYARLITTEVQPRKISESAIWGIVK